jgi:DNA modification methylase
MTMPKIVIRCRAAKTINYKTLKPFQGDLKKLTDENKQKLKSEIVEKGFTAPVFVWENQRGDIFTLDGHQRCKVLAELEKEGFTIPNIPVAIVQAADVKTAKSYLLGIVSQYGQITEAGLIGYIEDSKLDPKMLRNLRMPEIDIDNVIDQLDKMLNSEPPDADEAPALPAKAKTKRGDIFTLDGHRLMCGDATAAADMGALMGKDRARLVFTDPPYGVSYPGVAGNETEQIKNDELRGSKLQDFLQAAFECMFKFTIANPALYIFHASVNQRQFETALNHAKFQVKQQLIWNKGMILSRSDYHWAHEPIFYAIKAGKNCEWYGDRTGKTVLNLHPADVAKLTKEQMKDMLKALLNNTTDWEFKRDSVVTYQHPMQKPVVLASLALKNNSMPGDIVLDSFGGSGSTLMACQIMDRRCRTMELDEKYCDVIIGRWEKHTGKKAEIERK